MAAKKKFSRPLGNRRYRKLFLVAVEGIKTEPQYFSLLNEGNAVVRVECIFGKGSSPPQVLEMMSARIKKSGLKKGDEAWLVVDKDDWTEDQLTPLFEWSQTKTNYNFALSNPKFEYWLLLHFEDTTVSSSKNCSEKLSKHLPNYDKGIKPGDLQKSSIIDAVQRAKKRDTPPCDDWPRHCGTTVYKLVEQVLKERGKEN